MMRTARALKIMVTILLLASCGGLVADCHGGGCCDDCDCSGTCYHVCRCAIIEHHTISPDASSALLYPSSSVDGSLAPDADIFRPPKHLA